MDIEKFKQDRSSLFTIGRFAELADFSPKNLKYLEEKELLKPHYTDPESRYRYYSLRQLLKVCHIRLFQRFGFSYDIIKKITRTRTISELHDIFLKKYQCISKGITEKKKQIEVLNENIRIIERYYHTLEKLKQEQPDFEVSYLPERQIVSSRSFIPLSPESFREGFIRLFAEVPELEKVINHNHYSIFHENYETLNTASTDVEIAVGVDADGMKLPGKSVLQAGYYVTAIYHGLYEESLAVYRKLQHFLKRKGLFVKGPLIRKFYLHLAGAVKPGNFINEFQLLIDEKATDSAEIRELAGDSHG